MWRKNNTRRNCSHDQFSIWVTPANVGFKRIQEDSRGELSWEIEKRHRKLNVDWLWMKDDSLFLFLFLRLSIWQLQFSSVLFFRKKKNNNNNKSTAEKYTLGILLSKDDNNNESHKKRMKRHSWRRELCWVNKVKREGRQSLLRYSAKKIVSEEGRNFEKE